MNENSSNIGVGAKVVEHTGTSRGEPIEATTYREMRLLSLCELFECWVRGSSVFVSWVISMGGRKENAWKGPKFSELAEVRLLAGRRA